MHTDDIAGHQVSGPLDALEGATQGCRQRPRQQRLAEARDTLQQHMPANQERDRDRPDILTVADDDLAEFGLQRPL